MTATHNEAKGQGPVRVGLIAADQNLQPLAAAIDACLLIQPLGQAGMPSPGPLRDVPWLDDPRQLLSQPGIEAIMLATAARADRELAAMAGDRGLHVWRLPPLARSFAEATEVAALIKRLSCVYRVASWWEYVTDHVWHELKWPADFTPVFSELRVSAQGPPPGSRPASATDALGGALATDAYPLLESLVAVRGLPDSVAAAVGTYRRPAEGSMEDTIVAVLRYSGGGTAVLRVAWDLWPPERVLLHHASALTATLTDEEIGLTDSAGTPVDRHPLPGDFLTSELLRFAELVRGQARDRAAAPLERHLAVSALLEAIHLSARTGQPESPAKFYRVQGWPEPRP